MKLLLVIAAIVIGVPLVLVIAAIVTGVPLVNRLLGHAVDALLAWSENRKWR
jgi:hypothetical protein